MVLQQVPIIDIAPFLNGDGGGDDKGKRQVAEQVRKAYEDIGFFVVTGHGIAPNLITEVNYVSKQFFDLPHEEKMVVERWRMTSYAATRGR